MDSNNNPDDDTTDSLKMVKFQSINCDSVTTTDQTSDSVSVQLSTSASETNNENGSIMTIKNESRSSSATRQPLSAKNISIAWHNLRYDNDGDRARNNIRSQYHPLNLKNLLLLHRRGSVPTPCLPPPSSSSSALSPMLQSCPILRRLTGCFQYHSVNALLGPSLHARKTMIKCLCGSMGSGISDDSQIYFNLSERKPNSRWVPEQLDGIIFTQMSVQEILRYSFLFQNGLQHWSQFHQHVSTIFLETMLFDRNILYKKFYRCSPSEQRAIAISQELMCLTLPTFLFLDEPFSELDIISSSEIANYLRKLANLYPLTITISAQNLPQVNMIDIFNKLYILAHGGVCIFSGSPKQLAQTMIPQITKKNSTIKGSPTIAANDQESSCEKRPPIDEILKISCFEYTNPKVRKLADKTLQEEHQKLCPHLDQLRLQSRGIHFPRKSFHLGDLLLHSFQYFRMLFISQTFVLKLLVTIVYYVFLSFCLVSDEMIGSLNRCNPGPLVNTERSNYSCEKAIQNRFVIESYAAFQMYSMWFLASMSITSTALFHGRMLKIFQNERQNRRYSLGVFFLSSTVNHLLDSIFWSSISSILVLFLMDHSKINLYLTQFPFLNNLKDLRLYYFSWFYWILFLYHQSLGFLISVIFYKNPNSSIQLISLAQIIVLISQLLNNNILVIVERINSDLLRSIGNHLINLRSIYDGVIFVSYCDPRNSPDHQFSSSIINHHNIDSNQNIFVILIPVITFLIVIRLFTFIILWFRFRHHFPFFKSSPGVVQNKPTEVIPIDYGPKDSIRKKAKVRIIQPIFKDDDEVEFCRNKIQLAWRCLSLFSTSIKKNKSKQDSNLILQNLNGQFKLGTMNAVIGGRSKIIRTILLRVFSGQLKTCLDSDTTFYESEYIPISVRFISNQACNHLISGLTTKQSLIYASIIKNFDDNIPPRLDHEEMALNILDELDLGHQAQTLVEDCSLSEQKRLAIALELTSLQMPNMICIDEPTDGLDTVGKETLVRCMRQLTDRHSITFIASFHSINHQMILLFDQIYCLGQNGICIYSGPSNSTAILEHLQEIVGPIISETHPFEELLKYSCMNEKLPVIQKLIEKNNEQVLAANELLSNDTVKLPKGIKSNILQFSVILAQVLAKRYRGRWKSSLWFDWVMYSSIYLTIGLFLTGLFKPEIGKPDGCVRVDVFNRTKTCSLHRTGTAMILEEEADLLWDNYRYTHLANHLFLMVVLFHTASVFYREFKVFLHEHQNGWLSAGVFYLNHNIFIDLGPIIPVIIIYLYIVNYDHSQFKPEDHPSAFWWSVILMWIATKSFQSISHFVVLLFGSTQQNQSGLILTILLVIFAILFITSNSYIPARFTLSFLNVFRYLNEAIIVLQYGFFQHCFSVKQQMVSLVLYRMELQDPQLHFNHCFRVLLGQTFVFRVMSWFALLYRSNCDRIFHHHRMWSLSSSSSSSSSSSLRQTLPDLPLSLDHQPGPSSLTNASSERQVESSI